MASAELFRFRPISGMFPEKDFDATGKTTWVKFTDDDLDDWCGIFGTGLTSSCVVTCSTIGPHAFVASGGQGYFVDINSRTVLNKTHSDQITNAVFIPGSGDVIASDWTNLFILGPDGPVWKSARVSMDGIKFDEVTAEGVKGKVNDLSKDGVEFVLRFNPVVYECKWRCGWQP